MFDWLEILSCWPVVTERSSWDSGNRGQQFQRSGTNRWVMSEQGHCTMKMWYLWSYYSDHSGWSGKSESPEMAHRNHHYHNSVWEHARTLCSMVAWLIVIIIREYVITLYSLPKGKHSFKVPFFFFLQTYWRLQAWFGFKLGFSSASHTNLGVLHCFHLMFSRWMEIILCFLQVSLEIPPFCSMCNIIYHI